MTTIVQLSISQWRSLAPVALVAIVGVSLVTAVSSLNRALLQLAEIAGPRNDMVVEILTSIAGMSLWGISIASAITGIVTVFSLYLLGLQSEARRIALLRICGVTRMGILCYSSFKGLLTGAVSAVLSLPIYVTLWGLTGRCAADQLMVANTLSAFPPLAPFLVVCSAALGICIVASTFAGGLALRGPVIKTLSGSYEKWESKDQGNSEKVRTRRRAASATLCGLFRLSPRWEEPLAMAKHNVASGRSRVAGVRCALAIAALLSATAGCCGDRIADIGETISKSRSNIDLMVTGEGRVLDERDEASFQGFDEVSRVEIVPQVTVWLPAPITEATPDGRSPMHGVSVVSPETINLMHNPPEFPGAGSIAIPYSDKGHGELRKKSRSVFTDKGIKELEVIWFESASPFPGAMISEETLDQISHSSSGSSLWFDIDDYSLGKASMVKALPEGFDQATWDGTLEFHWRYGLVASAVQLFLVVGLFLCAAGPLAALCVALVSSVNMRKFEFAVLRAVGWTRTDVTISVFAETLILVTQAVLPGLILGALIAFILTWFSSYSFEPLSDLPLWSWNASLILVGMGLTLALLSLLAVAPALSKQWRQSAAKNLSEC